MANDFPQRLRKLREKMGLKRIVLGELCGVTGRTIRDYEEGISVPKLPVLIQMTVYLKCTMYDLTGY